MPSVETGHGPEHEELAALHAFDVLTGVEREDFALHLAGCERCQAVVDLDRRTLGRLMEDAPTMEPSAGFRERLLSRAAAEAAATGDPTPPPSVATAPLPFRPRRSSSPMLLPLAAMLVVGLALGSISAQRWYGEQELVAVALEGSQVGGSARVVLRRSGTAELRLNGLPDPGPGRVYQAWVIPPGGQPLPTGTHASGEGVIGLTAPVLGNTVAVTVEPAPGRPSPTGPPVFAAVVRA